MKRSLGAGLAATIVACARPAAPAVMPASEPPPAAPALPAAPEDPAPVRLAAYSPGSSCNLVLDRGALHWLVQTMADAPPPAGTCGAVLDCPRTRGALMRVATGGGEAVVVAKTSEWPWSLESDAESFYWIGYCSASLWSVPKAGGTPRTLGPRRLAAIDVEPTPDAIVVADRSGPSPGIFALDRGRGGARPVAARGERAFLLGALGSRVLWGEETGDAWTAHAEADGSRARLGGFRGMPMDSTQVGDDWIVRTTAAIVRVSATQPPVELAALSDYGDRGGLAIDATHIYWANGRAGTLARLDRASGAVTEAAIGGEPCGVAVDARRVYWLDRGREAVMRAPLSVFDAP